MSLTSAPNESSCHAAGGAGAAPRSLRCTQSNKQQERAIRMGVVMLKFQGEVQQEKEKGVSLLPVRVSSKRDKDSKLKNIYTKLKHSYGTQNRGVSPKSFLLILATPGAPATARQRYNLHTQVIADLGSPCLSLGGGGGGGSSSLSLPSVPNGSNCCTGSE